jgi:trk system potassium uptake protein TrkH
MVTNLSATISCISNIGPGLALVGPNGNFSMFSWFSKLVLIFDMLIGRLEIFPILLLCSPSFWRRNG